MREGVKMKTKRITLLVTFVVSLFVSAFVAPNVGFSQVRNGGYQITIYVDEGNDPIMKNGLPFGEWTGHTFIGLSDGKKTDYSGWNHRDKVESEDKYISQCEWDVKKTYDITKSGYEKALKEIEKWKTDGKRYDVDHHCGHFALAVAQASGLNLPFNESQNWGLRPGLFGEYLRNRGAEHSADTYYVNSYVDTKISVKRGDKLKFRANGTVKFGFWLAGSGGPEGIVFNTDYNYFTNRLHGCLIGLVKTPSPNNWDDWFYIGKGGEIISDTTGVLQLAVNDNEPEDNVGKFEVEVTVCPAK